MTQSTAHTPRKLAIRMKDFPQTPDGRLRRIGWTERVVRPELGPCWEWKGLRAPHGYGRIALVGRVMRLAHRVAYAEWVGALPDEKVVCHRCDNPPCINPAHLFAGEVKDNVRDMVSKTRHARGEGAGQHKLTEAEVLEIRAAHATGEFDHPTLASIYKVSPSNIGCIVRGKSWKHLPMAQGGAA